MVQHSRDVYVCVTVFNEVVLPVVNVNHLREI